MPSINAAILDFKRLDLLAYGDSPLHRLDARAKVLVTAAFIVSVVSHGRYELAALLPFFVFPVVMVTAGNLPAFFIARKIVLLCPFVIIIGLFNPLLDRQPLFQLGSVPIPGGWVSFLSIIVRSTLTIGAAFALLGLTGFTAICQALERLGMPRVFAVQLMFLYRYIFVLTEEGNRATRARELRSFGRMGLGIRSFSSLIGHLLLRTWQRAERIHSAMLSRGFTGVFHVQRQQRFGAPELIFVLGWFALFILLRLLNVSHYLGRMVTP